MIAFLQLPYRRSIATAPALGQVPGRQVLLTLSARHSTAHPRAVLRYLRLIQFRTSRELGPRVVGITLSLILAAQLALVLWLYLSLGRS